MPKAEAKYSITAEDKTGRAFESVRARFKTAASVATKTAAGIGAAAIGGFAAMATQAINAADEIGKLSREIGVSTENLSEMKGVIDLTGGSFEGYTTALTKMQKNILTLGQGSKAMAESFAELGLRFEDLEGLSPEQQFEKIARGLEGLEDATTRSAVAQTIFGRNARTVLRLVDAGADEVARLREEQRALGNTMGEDTTAAAEAFNDAIARMKQTLQGAVLGTLKDELPAIVEGMEAIVKLAPAVIKAFSFVSRLFSRGGELLGAGAAAVGAVATGNFGEAGAILRDAQGRVFGGEEELKRTADAAEETNALLFRLADQGIVGRAG